MPWQRPRDGFSASSSRPARRGTASSRLRRHGPAGRAGKPPELPDTLITLVLEQADPELAEAHWELYPERVPEQIPLSLTLLYPWIPVGSLTEEDLDGLRSFFRGRRRFDFDLTHVAEFPGLVVYAVPEPDGELRAMMRALWELYPQYPPYGRPGSSPDPHATLGRLEGEHAITLAAAEKRVARILPVHCDIREATLMQEREPDRWYVRENLPLGGG